MRDDELSRVLDDVGPRLRALRRRRGLTLAEVGADTAISVSTLSRLESGQRRPTLELLLALARTYRVPLDDLVGAPATGDPRVQLRPTRRHEATFIALTRRPGGVQAYKMITAPGWPFREVEPQTHEGHEWMYVLNGTMRLRLGESDLLLRPGEVAEFDTRLPHALSNPGPDVAEILVLFGPQGERIHVRARPTDAGT